MSWTPDRWTEIESLFHAAAQQPVATRAAFLASACAGDRELRSAVGQLLHADAQPEDELLDHGAMGLLRGKDPMLGARFAAFELVERIADGGMGSVYRATRVDADFAQEVAVKVLRLGLTNVALRERFARERQTLARLVHPHVARLLDGGTNEQGVPFFAMELIDGLPLDRWCDERAASQRERLQLFATVCRAVHFAHQNLVVHLDLKPSNILVDAHSVPKLLDFGVAGLLEDVIESSGAPARQRAFTPEYASPEQLRGEPPSTASDLYSLGVVLHELLTGRRPGAPAAAGTGRAGASLRGDLGHIVARCLRAEPAQRYTSCQELADDVDHFLRGLPIVARASTLGYRLLRFVARNRVVAGTTLLLVCVLVGGIASTLHMASVARGERDAADAARKRVEREMAHARIEATSSRIVSAFLGDTFLSAEFVGNQQTREKVRAAMRLRADQVRRQHSDNPHLRANLLDALGRACAQVDAFAEAEALLQEAAGLRVAHIGRDSLEHALSLTSLGRLRYQQGRYPEAVELLQACYRLHKSCAPDVHTDVAAAANDLAAAERACGNRQRARELHQEALELRRQGGTDPALVAESLNNLANSEPDLELARGHLVEAIAIRARVLGEDDPLTIQSRVNLGRLALAQGDFAGARPLLRDGVAACRRIAGLGTDALSPALAALAYAELRSGDLPAAGTAIAEALQLDRERFGATHPRIASDRAIQANVLERPRDEAAALAAWQEALRIRKAVLPAGHRDIPNTLCSVGAALVRQARAAEAVNVLTEARDLYAASREPRPIDVADTNLHLAAALEAVSRPEDAERALLDALAVQTAAPRLAATRQLLREFYLRQGRAADAARYAEEAAVKKD